MNELLVGKEIASVRTQKVNYDGKVNEYGHHGQLVLTFTDGSTLTLGVDCQCCGCCFDSDDVTVKLEEPSRAPFTGTPYDPGSEED